eukprot:3177831-Karenia_brevis.AAC.1
MQEIEDECKDKVDEIQDDLAKAMSTCLTDLEKNRKMSVERMRDTVRDYKDNAKVAEENMVLKKAKSSLSSPRRQDAPPRDSGALTRRSRFD